MAYKSYETSRIAAKRCYENRKKLGVCAGCTGPIDNGLVRCSSCIAKHRARDQRYKESARCATCGKPSDDGRLCRSCRLKKRDRSATAVKNGKCARCLSRNVVINQTQCSVCNEKRQRFILQIKLDTFMAYGGAECACCKEGMIECLQLDHIHNDGAEHRKMKMHGARLYRWLKDRGYPAGFQVLCANCNFAKGILGYCPHQSRLETSSL